MKIISTNIGARREITRGGKRGTTGIFKEPVGSIAVKKFHVVGDHVADLRVHGGENKAVYGYPAEHYPFWQHEFPGMALPWGAFGENITTEGLFEHEALIGSRYRIGTALLEVTEPRMPCSTLAAKFGSVDMIKRFLDSRRSGFYFTVIDEGEIAPGDAIILERAGDAGYSIRDVVDRHAERA